MAKKRQPIAGDAADDSPVGIVVTVDHVFLPLDEDGNGRTDWRGAEETTRLARRTRLAVPPDLAAFLSERDQAEIL